MLRGVECRVGHAERAEDFALAKAVERFSGEAFKGGTKDDESDVTVVFGTLARIGRRDVVKAATQ